MNNHHVDHRRRLTEVYRVDDVEVGDMVAFDMVDKEVVDGILLQGSHTLQPKGIGLRRVLHRGLIIDQA